jgi:adhesin transport system membrane fusion protein
VTTNPKLKLLMGSILLMVLLLGLLTFGWWASAFQLDIVTRAAGSIVPSSRVQSIQSLDGGVVDAILVKEGDIVEKGQILLRIEREKAQAIYRETLSRVASLEAAIARLRSEVLGVPLKFPESANAFPEVVSTQKILYSKRLAALNQEIAVLQETLRLVEKELNLNEPMLETGEVSEVDVIRLRRQVNEIRGAITQRRNKYLSESQAELAKAQDDLSSQTESLAARKTVLDQVDIYAPVKGVVKNIRITTQGGVVRPAEEIMQLVPIEEELLVEIKIKPADVAFLRPGLQASVKLDAYDYTIYGTLNGELTYISPDTLVEETSREQIKYYRGIIRTSGSKLRNPRSEKIEIIPGMTASAEIKTGQRSVMQYLLKPVTRGLKESLNER